MNKTLSVVLIQLLAVSAFAQKSRIYHKDWIDLNKNGQKDIYEDRTQPINKRVNDLVARMTLEEKSCQMATLYGYGRVLKDELPTEGWHHEVWKDGIANIDEELNSLPNNEKATSRLSFPFSRHTRAINQVQHWFIEQTRLGIPVDFTNEGIHGLCHDRATPLPAPISVGATWNKELIRRAGAMIGSEGRALGYTNIYVPILDPARDPRWGRVVECFGEDPYHIAELGKQMTLGVQSAGVASTLKHFAVYSVPKGGRDGNARTDPHVAPREMHQLFLYPFKRVIKEAEPLGIMSSYNDWDGVPVTGSRYFLTELLRQQFGFKGYVVSDSRAVEYISEKHHIARDFKEGTLIAIQAGLNVWTNFEQPAVYINNIRELVRENKLSMAVLDDRVKDVLRVKFLLGLFDEPYRDEKAADKVVHQPDDEALALQVNRESLVLLKNENELLPLKLTNGKKVLVTGPLADNGKYAVSRYGPSNNKITTVLAGLRALAGSNISIDYAKGCEVVNEGWPGTELVPTPLDEREQHLIDEAVTKAKTADIVVAVLGEDDKTVGESLSRTSLDLPGRQQRLLEALYATGRPVVLVLINGQPLTINWADHHIPSIIEAWFPGHTGGQAIAEALLGKINPGGKLSMTFPKSIGQIEFNFPMKPGSHADQPTSGPNGAGNTSVNGALYPFGHGLSYTQFTYSGLKITPNKQGVGGEITVQLQIQNTGKVKGDEVVQLYIQDKISSVITYETVLRGFERITLEPGETKTVVFTIKPEDLEILDINMNWTVEPGEFGVLVGSSSTDIRLRGVFEIN